MGRAGIAANGICPWRRGPPGAPTLAPTPPVPAAAACYLPWLRSLRSRSVSSGPMPGTGCPPVVAAPGDERPGVVEVPVPPAAPPLLRGLLPEVVGCPLAAGADVLVAPGAVVVGVAAVG